MTSKTILRVFKATFKGDDYDCYIVFKGPAKLPEIDATKYNFNYYINSIDNCIHLCWVEK